MMEAVNLTTKRNEYDLSIDDKYFLINVNNENNDDDYDGKFVLPN